MEMNRHYKTLELDKILQMLAEETAIAESAENALRIASTRSSCCCSRQRTRICSSDASARRRSAASTT